ncbi:MAG TPA: hypoxanthine phosphoribosyltransferase [Eubacteriaceae bacterium]|nr:hypoxanthine phosphoribosyltransferase [Eubacteriaceae bacterium]
MHKDIDKILIDEETLKNRVKELGEQLSKDYEGKDPLVICVLKGAVLFMAEVVQYMKGSVEMDFMAVSSYGNRTTSSGEVRIVKDLEKSIYDRDLLIIEDIIDSGMTLSYLMKIFNERGVKDVKVCSLLDKPEKRISEVQADYVGFEVPDEFVVGYGLDFAEHYRNLPYIGVLKEEIYKEQE